MYFILIYSFRQFCLVIAMVIHIPRVLQLMAKFDYLCAFLCSTPGNGSFIIVTRMSTVSQNKMVVTPRKEQSWTVELFMFVHRHLLKMRCHSCNMEQLKAEMAKSKPQSDVLKDLM